MLKSVCCILYPKKLKKKKKSIQTLKYVEIIETKLKDQRKKVETLL